jgi:hypothetical protein
MSDPTLLDDEMLDEYDFSHAKRGNPYLQANRNVKIETADGSDRLVQIKTVELTAIVNPDGTTTLQLPPSIPSGKHHFTLLIQIESPLA